MPETPEHPALLARFLTDAAGAARRQAPAAVLDLLQAQGVDLAMDMLKRDDIADDVAATLCRFIADNARDARRYTALDILKVLEGEAHAR